MTQEEVVLAFWEAIASNDFAEAAGWLTEDFEGYWPQSSEAVVGRKNFTEINAGYPAAGPWRFRVNSIVADGDRVVTDVSITDGSVKARAITFHTVRDGLISRQREYWPESYEAPAWRRRWVEIREEL